MSHTTRRAALLRVMRIRMGSQSIIQVLRIMWRRLRLTTLGSSQIAIMTLVAVAESVVIAMGSVMVVIDYRMESVADIMMARLETAAAEGVALRRHHSSHQTLAAVLF
ncbi:MAG: hypothetical protein Q8Q81_16470 [Oxalobacteraceae bacterium]|nr:hypothetical protein [Oxalobacteraceae bacterium]